MIGIALFGFFGAVTRYLCYVVAENRTRHAKFATWFVNSSGSLAIGLCLGGGMAATSGIVGFLGAFTTFSTMALDCVKDVEDGRWRQASVYIFATLLAGLALFAFGYHAASSF